VQGETEQLQPYQPPFRSLDDLSRLVVGEINADRVPEEASAFLDRTPQIVRADFPYPTSRA
jgi:hypothetical protein